MRHESDALFRSLALLGYRLPSAAIDSSRTTLVLRLWVMPRCAIIYGDTRNTRNVIIYLYDIKTDVTGTR